MTEPKFTDSDLKRLKDDNYITHPDNIKALLHRLECAENLIHARDVFINKPSTITEKLVEEAEDAWEASKGEGGR